MIYSIEKVFNLHKESAMATGGHYKTAHDKLKKVIDNNSELESIKLIVDDHYEQAMDIRGNFEKLMSFLYKISK